MAIMSSIGTWIDTPKNTIDTDEILNHTHNISLVAPSGFILFWDLSNGSIPNNWEIYENLIGNYPCGSNSNELNGTTANPALPNITGRAGHQENDHKSTGCFVNNNYNNRTDGFGARNWSTSYNYGYNFDASRCSDVYKNNFNSVRPPTCYLVPIIKKVSSSKTEIGNWIKTPNGIIDKKEILNHTHTAFSALPSKCILFWDLSKNSNIPENWSIYTKLLGNYPCGSQEGRGELADAAIPNISGEMMYQEKRSFIDNTPPPQYGTGCFLDIRRTLSIDGLGANDWKTSYKNGVEFNAAKYNSIYKDNFDSVRPPTCYLLPIIKN